MGILDIFRGSTDERIARRLMAELRSLGETRPMEFDKDEALVVVRDGEGESAARWNLYHLRHELEGAEKSEHDDIYRRYASSFRDADATPESYEVIRPRLRLLLKDESWPAYIQLMNQVESPGGKSHPLVARKIAADVMACAVYESASSLSFVTFSELTTWNVNADQVLDDAIANVRALPMETGGETPEIRWVHHDDSFIASRIVCEEELRRLPLAGYPVAAVPDRDTLFLVGSEDESSLLKLANLIHNQFEAASRIVSGRVLVLKPGGWEEFSPPESLRIPFGNLARRYDERSWSDFKKYLERDLEARGEDVFVAEMMLCEIEATGEIYSTLAWTRGVDSILPAVDRVHFYDIDDKSIRVAEWADALRVMGTRMQLLQGPPARYRVNAFPTPEEFLSMGAKLK